jgi:phthalate 4,5-cis-dihydrodiol dehydrogenase
MTDRKLRLGIAGLGRAFSLMIPTFVAHPLVEVAAGADPRPEARTRFAAEFHGDAYATVEELCHDRNVEAIYIATPHQFHAGQVARAAAAGKHVLVEKPMALSLAECRQMIAATRAAGVTLVVGHSHSFDAPIARTRALVAGGDFGNLRMITALNFTDFLYRPRRPEELDTARGGGVVFNQAAHHVDVVRLLGGGRVKSVRAATGRWDPSRPTEGAYACFLTFEDGAFASMVYSGYAHFDSDEFCGWIGEGGQKKDPAHYGAARRFLAAGTDELALKNARNYGAPGFVPPQERPLHPHFGPLIVSCDKADLRPLPSGVMVYADGEQRLEPLPAPDVPRAGVIDELYEAAVAGKTPLHSGEWALATMEVILAMLRSAKEGKEIALKKQTSASRI